jgi:hypothetical protein
MIRETREMTRESSKLCSRKRRQVRHGESVLWRTAALQSPESFRGETFVSIRVHSWLALQHGNEMANLVFHISGHCHGLGYLIT